MPIPTASDIRYNQPSYYAKVESIAKQLHESADKLRAGEMLIIDENFETEQEAWNTARTLHYRGFAVSFNWTSRVIKVCLPEHNQYGLLMPEGWEHKR